MATSGEVRDPRWKCLFLVLTAAAGVCPHGDASTCLSSDDTGEGTEVPLGSESSLGKRRRKILRLLLNNVVSNGF